MTGSSVDSGLVLALVAIGLTFAAIYHHLKRFSFWSSRGIKGPTPWPLVGTNIYYFFRNRVEVDEEWREKYGDVYGFYNGYYPILRVTDNDLVRHIYIKNFSSFTDRDNDFIYGDNISRWLFWSSGSHWANQRALITPLFAGSRMRAMFSSMQSCMSSLTNEIGSRLVGSGEKKKVDAKTVAVLSKDEFMAATLDVIGQTFFGLKLNTYRDKTSEFFKRAYAFASFDVPRMIVWLMVPHKLSQLIKFDLVAYSKYEYFDKLGQSTINERRRLGATGAKRNDLIQFLLDARLPDDNASVEAFNKEDDLASHYNDHIDYRNLQAQHERQQKQAQSMRHFDDIEIRAQMTFFFLAGFETTSSSLSFCFFELAHQQEIQQEVFEELRLVLDKSGGQLDYERVLELKKMDAFVSEALRLYAPVTENNRKVTAKEGVVLPTSPPIRLPYGTAISTPPLVLQRHPKYWKNPLKFDMSRFYPENRDQLQSCTYMPFGLGPRNCAGMRFALLNIKLCLAQVLSKYHVSPGAGTQQYPPKFNRHSFFLQLKHSDFKLSARSQS